MANNPYVNKVQMADGTSVIDISDTTATASDVAQGKYFYLATGQKIAGSSSGGSGLVYTYEDYTLSPTPTKSAIANAVRSGQEVIVYVTEEDTVYRFKYQDNEYTTVTFESTAMTSVYGFGTAVMEFSGSSVEDEFIDINFFSPTATVSRPAVFKILSDFDYDNNKDYYYIENYSLMELFNFEASEGALTLHGVMPIAPPNNQSLSFSAFIDTSNVELIDDYPEKVVWRGTAVDVTNGRLHCYTIEYSYNDDLAMDCLLCTADTVFPLTYTAWNGGNY